MDGGTLESVRKMDVLRVKKELGLTDDEFRDALLLATKRPDNEALYKFLVPELISTEDFLRGLTERKTSLDAIYESIESADIKDEEAVIKEMTRLLREKFQKFRKPKDESEKMYGKR